jgi:hypothetical protein
MKTYNVTISTIRNDNVTTYTEKFTGSFAQLKASCRRASAPGRIVAASRFVGKRFKIVCVF